ncbi:MAG: hypothetical protein AAFV53_13685, partial [Myxococcota bacterium]
WTDGSDGADRRRWALDGADAGDAEQVSLSTDAPGVSTLSLRVDSPAWGDEASLMITINDCTPDEEETGEPDNNEEDPDDAGPGLDSAEPVSSGTAPQASRCSTVVGGGWAWLAVIAAFTRRRRAAPPQRMPPGV